jgi:hypothetical protein
MRPMTTKNRQPSIPNRLSDIATKVPATGHALGYHRTRCAVTLCKRSRY